MESFVNASIFDDEYGPGILQEASEDYYPEVLMDSTNVVSTVFQTLVCIWIIVSNIFLILSIIINKTRRERPLHMFIVNLAVADLLVGILVAPLFVHYLRVASWQFGAEFCIAWAILDMGLCTVSVYALVIISLDRFLLVMRPTVYMVQMKKWAIVAMLLFPWLLSALIVLLIYLIGTSHTSYIIHGHCVIDLSQKYLLAANVTCYFLPVTCALLLNVGIVVLVCLKYRGSQRRHDTQQRIHTTATISIVIVNCFFIVMWLPFFVFHTIVMFMPISVNTMVIQTLLWLGYANSGANPVLWMIYKDIRMGYRRLLCCCCPKRLNTGKRDDLNGYEDETLTLNNM